MSLPMTAVATAIATAVALACARPLLTWLGVVDVPVARSSHRVPTLRGAGVAVAAGVVVGVATLLPWTDAPVVLAVAVAAVLYAALGAVEDGRGVPVTARLVAQAVLGLGSALALCLVLDVPPAWALPAGAAVVTAVNVANFMDGIDAISGLHGVVAGAASAVVGGLTGESWLVGVGIVTATAFGVFLPFNLLGARMFLGDAGSYLLGALVSLTAVAATFVGVPLLAAAGVAAPYLADTSTAILRRARRRAPLHEAHREHVYQALVDAGRRHLPVAGVVAGASAASASLGLLSLRGGGWSWVSAAGIAVVVTAYLALPQLSNTRPAAGSTPAAPVAATSSPTARWVVLGASGFVGGHVLAALRASGRDVRPVAAPRLRVGELDVDALVSHAELVAVHDDLRQALEGADVVVNCAGLATPGAGVSDALRGANALLPVVVAAAAPAGSRLVHLSSAAVQGRTAVLDESPRTAPRTAYATSKALGEAALLRWRERHESTGPGVVVLRATSVQGAGRPTTESLRRVARSRLASVAAPGDRPTPVTSVESLAELVVRIGSHAGTVPAVVLQPWEGMTTGEVVRLAGGRAPRALPAALCRLVVTCGYVLATLAGPRLDAAVRRVELLWFGQQQVPGWCVEAGLAPAARVAAVLAGPSPTHGRDPVAVAPVRGDA